MKSLDQSGGGICRPRNTCACRAMLVVAALFQFGSGTWHIKELARFDRGIYGGGSYVLPHADSVPHLVLSAFVPNSFMGLHFYRHEPMNRYELVKVDTGTYLGQGPIIPGNMLPWVAGDLDGDSAAELIGHTFSNGDNLVTVYAPPAGGMIPDSLTSCVRYGGSVADAHRFYLTDLDRDGKKEVTFRTDIGPTIMAYEWSLGDSLRQVISVPCGGY